MQNNGPLDSQPFLVDEVSSDFSSAPLTYGWKSIYFYVPKCTYLQANEESAEVGRLEGTDMAESSNQELNSQGGIQVVFYCQLSDVFSVK